MAYSRSLGSESDWKAVRIRTLSGTVGEDGKMLVNGRPLPFQQ